ncbi:MAG TPA: homoserine kinase [bacterium]|nr:homoserine kinase [bacterium]
MVTVRVPATIANLGPAFDALGIAVSLYNTVELEGGSSAQVEVHGEGEGDLSLNERNLVYRAASVVAAECGRSVSFHIRCRNDIPLARGLGSSAAAIVGGMVAANALLGRLLDDDVLLRLAVSMEGHPDNVAPALFGGAVVCAPSAGAVTYARLTPAWHAAVVVAVPAFSVSTEEARRRLPTAVPFGDAAANVARTAALVASLVTGRTDLLGHAMDDALHQPYRRPLVPGMDAVFAAARRAGAYGTALAGSGPSIVALTPSDLAGAVGGAMIQAFRDTGTSARALTLRIDETGATVI